jgi:hypothetical protein
VDLKKMGYEYMDWIQLAGQDPDVWSFEHGDEPWGSIKDREFLDQLIHCQLQKKDFTPWI